MFGEIHCPAKDSEWYYILFCAQNTTQRHYLSIGYSMPTVRVFYMHTKSYVHKAGEHAYFPVNMHHYHYTQ